MDCLEGNLFVIKKPVQVCGEAIAADRTDNVYCEYLNVGRGEMVCVSRKDFRSVKKETFFESFRLHVVVVSVVYRRLTVYFLIA